MGVGNVLADDNDEQLKLEEELLLEEDEGDVVDRESDDSVLCDEGSVLLICGESIGSSPPQTNPLLAEKKCGNERIHNPLFASGEVR